MLFHHLDPPGWRSLAGGPRFRGAPGGSSRSPASGQVPASAHVTQPRRQELSIPPLHLPHQETFLRARGPRTDWPSPGNGGTHQNALALPPPSPASRSPPVRGLSDQGFAASFCPGFPARTR